MGAEGKDTRPAAVGRIRSLRIHSIRETAGNEDAGIIAQIDNDILKFVQNPYNTLWSERGDGEFHLRNLGVDAGSVGLPRSTDETT
jgi:hypothetical protein